MKSIPYILFIFMVFGFSKTSIGQIRNNQDSDLVQFTGFVVNYDSTKTIPFVTIRIAGTSRGTYSDMQGYFSFVAKKSDLIILSSIGYETKLFKFPEKIKGTKFKSVVTLVEDTFFLQEYVVTNRPSPEQMDYIFSRAKIPMDDYNQAQANLRKKPLDEMAAAMVNDGYENAKWTFNQYANKAYYNGQSQPIPVMDVFAWNQFLKSLQSGKKKRQ